jgi:MscS family membrane protein
LSSIVCGAAPTNRSGCSRPEVFDEIDLIAVDNYLPNFVPRLRIGGVRLFAWLAVLLVVPLWYRLAGFARIPGVLRLLTLSLAIHWVLPLVDFPLLERQLWAAVAAFLALIAGVWALLHLNEYGVRYVTTHFRDASLVEVISLVRLGHRIADVLAVVIGMLVGLRYFGMDPTAALAGLGIGGIAVALAAQKTLENVIGGLSLIFDKAVRVGDVLKVGDAAGTIGVVDSIGLRSTRIRTLDRTILTVPNGQIANVSLETMSARDMCRFYHTLGLTFGTSAAQIRKVIEGIREKLAAHPAVDASTVRVRLIRFAPSSLDIEVFAYVLTGDWARFLEVQEQLLVSIMDVVERAGTSLAFPTQTLHLSGTRATPALEAGAQPARRV